MNDINNRIPTPDEDIPNWDAAPLDWLGSDSLWVGYERWLDERRKQEIDDN